MKSMKKRKTLEHEIFWTVPYRFLGVRKVASGTIDPDPTYQKKSPRKMKIEHLLFS